MPVYAVRKGEKPGIYKTWPECQAQVKDFKGAQFKKFDSIADAEKFLGYDLAKTLKEEIAKLKDEAGDDSSEEQEEKRTSKKRKSTEDDKKSKKKKKESSSEDEDEDDDDDEDEGGAGDGAPGGVVPESVLEKAKKVSVKDYPTSDDGYVVCYTDGSSFSMGKKGPVSGVGVYFGPDHKMNLAEPLKDDGKAQTHNRAKILAVAYAIETLKASGVKEALVHLDSEFTMNCVDKWMPGWKKKGWKTAAGADVKNKEELQLVDRVATIDVRYSRAADESEPSGYSEATKLAKEGAKKTHA